VGSVSLLDVRHRNATVGIVAVIGVVAFELLAVATAMPFAADELGGRPLYGWAFTVFLIASLLGMSMAGGLSDSGRLSASMFGSLLLFAIGSVVAGLASRGAVFLGGRALQGLGGGGMVVAAYALLGAVYPAVLRARAFAAVAAAWVLAAVVGPVVAGAVTALAGWRWVFLGLTPIVGAVVLCLRGPMRQVAAELDTVRPRPAIAVPLAAAAAGAGVALVQHGAQRLDLLGGLLAGLGVGLLVVGVRQLLPRGSAVLAPGLPAVIGMRAILAATFQATGALIPLTMAHLHGYGPTSAGLPLLVGALGVGIGSWWQSRRAEPDYPTLLRTGFCGVAIGCLAMPAAVVPALKGWPAGPLWLVAGVGVGLALGATGVLLLDLSPPEARGANAAAMQLGDAILTAVAMAVGGALVALSGGRALSLHHAVTLFALSMGCLAVTAATFAGRVQVRAPHLRAVPTRSQEEL
jgi:MFS family permease